VVACMFLRCRKRPFADGMCRRHAVEEADRLFSLYIRRRDGRCTACGSTRDLQCSHHISRARVWTRWDVRNATTHCARCHYRFTRDPAAHHDAIMCLIGTRGWSNLMNRAYGPIVQGRRMPPGPLRGSDLEAVLARLRRMSALQEVAT